MPGVKSNHKRKFTRNVSPKNLKNSLTTSGDEKGFKKRLLSQTSKTPNSPSSTAGVVQRSSRKLLVPKGKKALKKVTESQQMLDANQISTDGAEPSTPLTEYAQYLGLQPTVKFKCYKCHESCFPSMHKLQEHQNNCLRTYRTSGSEALPSASIEPPPTTNFRITRKVYLCSACGTYYENWNLFLHMREVHNRHICLYCLGMFSQADKLSVHLTAKHGVREREIATRAQFLSVFQSGCFLMCDTCEQVFTEKDEFHDHACLDLAALAADRACSLCGLRGSHFPTCRRAYAEMFSPPQINATRIVSLSSDTTIVPLPSELGIQDKSLTIAQYLIPLDKLVQGVQGEGLLIGPRAFFPTEENLEDIHDRTRDLSDLDSEYDISDAATFCHVDIEEDTAKHSPFHVYYPTDTGEPINISDPTAIQQSFSIYALPELQQAPCHFYEPLEKEQFCRISELPQTEFNQSTESNQFSNGPETALLELQEFGGNKQLNNVSASDSSDHVNSEKELLPKAPDSPVSKNHSRIDQTLNMQHETAGSSNGTCSDTLSGKEKYINAMEEEKETENMEVKENAEEEEEEEEKKDEGEEKLKEVAMEEEEEKNENEKEDEGPEKDKQLKNIIEDDQQSPVFDKQTITDVNKEQEANIVENDESEISCNSQAEISQKGLETDIGKESAEGATLLEVKPPLPNEDEADNEEVTDNENEEKAHSSDLSGTVGGNETSLIEDEDDDDVVDDDDDDDDDDNGIDDNTKQSESIEPRMPCPDTQAADDDKTEISPINGEKIGDDLTENRNQASSDLSKHPLVMDENQSVSPDTDPIEQDDGSKSHTLAEDKSDTDMTMQIDGNLDLNPLQETSLPDDANICQKTPSATDGDSESESSDSGGESQSNGSTSSSDVSSEENEEAERKSSTGKEKTTITEESEGDNADSDKLSLVVDENRSTQDNGSVKDSSSNHNSNYIAEETNAKDNEVEGEEEMNLQVENCHDSEEARQMADEKEQSEDPSENIQIAGDDVPILELTLEENLDVLQTSTLVKECVKISCGACVFCNHAKKIAVNGKQLILHILAEHRFEPVVCSDSGELTAVEGFVDRLKTALSELQDIFFNTDSYDSSDKTFSRPYDGTYECFHCNFITTLHKELYVHNRKMHQKTILLCIMCKSNFYSYSELLCHLCPGIYVPNSNITFRCCLCEVDGLPSAFRLMVHLRKRHHACDVCLEATGDQQKLSNHVWKHKLHHLCYRCGIAYRNKPDITKHLFWKHGTESVLCKKCLQKKWPHVYHFCIPPNAFVCEECNASFSRAVALRVHRRWHGGEFPYGCDECEDRFISRKLLAKHRNKHQQSSAGKQSETVDGGKEIKKPSNPTDEREDNLKTTSDLSAELVNSNADSVDNISVNATDISNTIASPLLKSVDTNLDENLPESVPSQTKNVPEEPYCELKKSKVVDVYDLPPLNLSSDSDDSDLEVAVKPPHLTKEEDNPKEDGKISEVPNIGMDLKGQAIEEMSSMDEEPAQILDGVWDNFKTYTAKLEQRGAFQSENSEISSGKANITESPSNFADSAVVIVEHDYCAQVMRPPDEVLEQDNEGVKQQAVSPSQNIDNEVTERKLDDEKNTCFDVDHNYCFSTSPHQEEKDTSAASVSTPSKKKQKSPKKKQKHSGSSSSSDSSSSDSSSCSCGTNCSCSSSSSSSSGSSSSQSTDSDSSSSEGRRRQAARRERRKERAKKKLELNPPDVNVTVVEPSGSSLISLAPHPPPVASLSPPLPQTSMSPPQSLPPSPSVSPVPPDSAMNGVVEQEDQFINSIGEDEDFEIKDSDLDTDEPETDEDFYDKYPQKPVSRVLTEKRNQLLLLAQVAPVGNGMVPQPVPPPIPETKEQVPKKKVKSKKHKKSQHQHSSSNKRVENKLKLNIPPSYYNSPTRFSIASPTRSVSPLINPTNLGPSGQLPRLPLDLYSAQTVEPSVSSLTYHSTGSGSDTDSRRSSKRKRVPKKFYGDSSDEDGDHASVQPYKWRKVGSGSGGSLHPTVQTVTPSGSYFKNSNILMSDTVRVLNPSEQDKSEDEGGDESDSGREVKRSTSDSSNSDSEGEKEQDEELSDADSDADAASFPQITSVPSGSMDTTQQQKNENLYCYCQCPYDEVSEMIACDGKECTIEWFHFECVGIMVPPKGKWFCPDCRKKSAGRGEYLDNS
ncbi:uncharacterized protein [Anabrus simplex]|uniref:uncharacterized protein n=1 Tax=Anabrus simplex TaxID=316456 RepID=UPI0035A2AF91